MEFSLRNHWSTIILHISAYINKKKQSLLTVHGIVAFLDTLLIVGAEILLLFISLPSYIAAESVANPSTSSGQAQKYRLRKAVTFSVIGTLLVIWIIKLALILTLVGYVKTQSTTINETQNRLGNTQTYADDILIAKESSRLSPPTVTKIQNTHGQIAFWGNAPANSIVVFAFSDKIKPSAQKDVAPKIYSTQTDASGYFALLEVTNVFNLPQGDYNGSASSYDPGRNIKSAQSQTFSFTVKETLWNVALHSADIILNILALLAIATGLLMTILVS